jgi:predicted TIM-barrel fold metal-dependent hydrolase
MLDSLSRVDVTAEEKEMILGGNAARLLKLKPSTT